VVEALRRQGRIESADGVYAQLRDIICDQLGVKAVEVIPSARFVDDLGAD
jgi:acyl carrier protein